MSLAGFGGSDEAPARGKAIFHPADQNNMKATLYGSDAPATEAQGRATGRKAMPGAGHPAESPFALGVGMDTSPRPLKKNNKWDTGAAKVGAAGVNDELNRHNYEATQVTAAQMKQRNQHGGGNFLSFDQQEN